MGVRLRLTLTRRVLPARLDGLVSLAAAAGAGWLTASAVRSLLVARRTARVRWDDWFIVAWWAAWCLAWCIVLGIRFLTFARRRQILRSTRQGLCGRCGYDLHFLKTNRCPECGTYFLMSWETLGRSRPGAGVRPEPQEQAKEDRG